jgi:hypothetical protein
MLLENNLLQLWIPLVQILLNLLGALIMVKNYSFCITHAAVYLKPNTGSTALLLADLMQAEEVKDYAGRLTEVARQLNSFASSLKTKRSDSKLKTKTVCEPGAKYAFEALSEDANVLFIDDELDWLEH